MTFATLQFAQFMAITFLIYYIVPKKLQWVILTIANCYFYYQTGLSGFLVMLGITGITYLFGLAGKKFEDGKKSKTIMMFLPVILIAVLFSVMRLGIVTGIACLGLSYYSLMSLGYIIDVFRGSVEPEKNPLKLLLYISYFPHIIQGPFDDYTELKKQFYEPHYFDYERAVKGIYRITFGLMKKMVLADRIDNIVRPVYANPEGYRGLSLWICVVLYAFQLYADFSGYMDIAIGCSELFGISIKENFNVPFLSKSMAEFWRRWHMSLGIWFKNYVFYPVQRTKLCDKIRKSMKEKKNKYGMKVYPSVIGLAILWTLIGLWHGFDWNYLLYDWICGLIIISSELLKPAYDKLNKSNEKLMKSKFMDVLRVVRTFMLTVFTFIIFRPDTIGDSLTILKNMFSGLAVYNAAEYVYWNAYDFFLIFPAFIILLIVDIKKYKEIDVFERFHKMNPVIRYVVYVAGLVFIYVAKHAGETVGFAYAIF